METLLNGCDIEINVNKYQFLGGKKPTPPQPSNYRTKDIRNAFFPESLVLTGEHCLDPDAYLLDLYHINPHAEWIIKQNPSYPRMY